MKKIIALISLVLLLLTACDGIPNGVIENSVPDYEVIKVEAPKDVYYNSPDSAFVSTLQFDKVATIKSVWFDVVTEDGETKIRQDVQMMDNGDISNYGDKKAGDKIYSGRTILTSDLSSGKYYVNYYVADNVSTIGNEVRYVVSSSFVFHSGKENSAPVIGGLIMPDSINAGEKFTFSVQASDKNGLSDIVKVYYELYDPDGNKLTNSQGISQFPLSDNGDTQTTGDNTAGDGVYTMTLTFPSNSKKGIWKFDFAAVDKADSTSNIISHNLTVK